MKATFLAGAACLALTACRMDDPCEAPSNAACGGDPTGEWAVVDSCRDPAYVNPEAVTYYGQPQTMARQPPPEPTSSDWCSYLKYDPGMGIMQFTFPHDTLDIRTGPVTYSADGKYATKLLTTGSGSVALSASCLTRFAVLFVCGLPDANTAPGTRSLTQDMIDYSIDLGAPAQNIVCTDDGNGGCFCSYELTSEPTGGGLSGRWSTQGALISHFAGTNLIPSQADLCVSGDTMTIWGHNRAAIWDQPGLRTLKLMRQPAAM
jgi:hypothetical protein